MKKKSLFLIISVLVIASIFAGCSKSVNDEAVMMDSMPAEAPREAMEMEKGDMYYAEAEEEMASNGDDGGGDVDYSEKIIYNANMGIVVDDPVETAKQIKKQVDEMGGYVSSSYSNRGEGSRNYVNMQIRVPAKGLNNMVEYLYSISDVEYDNMYTDNITESYYDTVARLEHEQLQEKQLQELMEKAETIEDILTVRQELSRVQETIEVYQGRIRRWDSLVDYSTIDISISPTPTIVDDDGPIRLIPLKETGKAIVRALDNSWRFVANFFSFLFRIIAALIIPAIIIVPITIGIVKLAKRRKANKPPKEPKDK